MPAAQAEAFPACIRMASFSHGIPQRRLLLKRHRATPHTNVQRKASENICWSGLCVSTSLEIVTEPSRVLS